MVFEQDKNVEKFEGLVGGGCSEFGGVSELCSEYGREFGYKVQRLLG